MAPNLDCALQDFLSHWTHANNLFTVLFALISMLTFLSLFDVYYCDSVFSFLYKKPFIILVARNVLS